MKIEKTIDKTEYLTDVLFYDFILKDDYLDWLKENHPKQFCENMTPDMVIRQRVYSLLYRLNFFNPKADYLYHLDDENEAVVKFTVNMSKMFRDKDFLFPMLRNSFKDEERIIFDHEFGMCSPYNLN